MHPKVEVPVLWVDADALLAASEQKSPKGEANVKDEKQEQKQAAREPAATLIRFLQEPKKEGHFTNLQVDDADGAEDTVFIGDWAAK